MAKVIARHDATLDLIASAMNSARATAATAGNLAAIEHKHEVFNRVAAAGAVYIAAFAKADSQPKTASAQPDCARNIQLVTAGGFTSSASISVTVKGTIRGVANQSRTYVMTSAGTTVQGTDPFEHIVSVTWTTPAGWTAGTIAIQGGTALGLALPPSFANLAVSKESGQDESAVPPVVADNAVGTVDATNGLYTPTAAFTSAHQTIQVWFSYNPVSAFIHADAFESPISSSAPVSTSLAADLVAGVRTSATLTTSVGIAVGDTVRLKNGASVQDIVVTANNTGTGVVSFASQTVVGVTAAGSQAVDVTQLVKLVNELASQYVFHIADAVAHLAVDAVNTLTVDITKGPACSDSATAQTVANDLKAKYNLHLVQSGVHYTNDVVNANATADGTDPATTVTLAVALKASLNAHWGAASAPAGASIRVVNP